MATSEYVDRVSAQRKVLRIVNTSIRGVQLASLSRDAIDQWALKFNSQDKELIVSQLVAISAKLFFLANKSQQQITEEYRSISEEVAVMTYDLAATMKVKSPTRS